MKYVFSRLNLIFLIILFSATSYASVVINCDNVTYKVPQNAAYPAFYIFVHNRETSGASGGLYSQYYLDGSKYRQAYNNYPNNYAETPSTAIIGIHAFYIKGYMESTYTTLLATSSTTTFTVCGAPTGSPSTPTDAGVYTSSTTITVNWGTGTTTDTLCSIVGYHLQVGTTPGGNNKFDGDVGNVLTYAATGCSNGATYYARVSAQNDIGLYSAYSGNSDGITIDSTPPIAPSGINDGISSDIQFANSSSQLSANWTAGSDPESGVAKYWYAIGTTIGGTDTTGWIDNGNSLSVTKTGLSLTQGQTYYFTVKAENGVGLQSGTANSNGQKVDTTIPTGTPSVPTNPMSTSYISSITVNWTQGTSADSESGIAGYYLQVGTTPGGNDKFDGDVGNVLTYAITGCSNGATYYARVRAKNGAGLYGSYSGNSVGVLISIDTTPPQRDSSYCCFCCVFF